MAKSNRNRTNRNKKDIGGMMNILKTVQKFLCKLGYHVWEYNKDKTKRWCLYCGLGQEKFANVIWCECIDGEPVE